MAELAAEAAAVGLLRRPELTYVAEQAEAVYRAQLAAKAKTANPEKKPRR